MDTSPSLTNTGNLSSNASGASRGGGKSEERKGGEEGSSTSGSSREGEPSLSMDESLSGRSCSLDLSKDWNAAEQMVMMNFKHQ